MAKARKAAKPKMQMHSTETQLFISDGARTLGLGQFVVKWKAPEDAPPIPPAAVFNGAVLAALRHYRAMIGRLGLLKEWTITDKSGGRFCLGDYIWRGVTPYPALGTGHDPLTFRSLGLQQAYFKNQ